MIQKTTLDFLANLAQNNNKTWFDANRTAYESARKDVLAFAGVMIKGISEFDPEIANANIDPKSTISRINRDIRFSNDKSPYKTNFFILVNAEGKKSNKAGYYIEIRPQGCFIGGGAYMPMPEDLAKFRQEIDYNFEAWKRIVENHNFLKVYPNGIETPEKRSRPPKGIDADNPAIEYLKMKGFYTWKSITDHEMMNESGLLKIMEGLHESHKVNLFLNQAL